MTTYETDRRSELLARKASFEQKAQALRDRAAEVESQHAAASMSDDKELLTSNLAGLNGAIEEYERQAQSCAGEARDLARD